MNLNNIWVSLSEMSDKNIDLFHDIQIFGDSLYYFYHYGDTFSFSVAEFFWTNIVIVWVLSFELIIIYNNSKLFMSPFRTSCSFCKGKVKQQMNRM